LQRKKTIMALMKIQLIPDPQTGRKNIIISLRSDADALPHEHEQQHRALVEKLIHGGTLKAGEVGNIIVEREEEAKAPGPVEQQPEAERKAQQHGH
jgi:hypothetical protein